MISVGRNRSTWRRWLLRVAATALVGLTALGAIGHAVNVVRHSITDKLGDGGCIARWVNQAAVRPIRFENVKNNKMIAAPVRVNCHGIDASEYQLSFHVYDGQGRVLRFDNSRFPFHGKRGVLKLAAGDLAAFAHQTIVIRPDLVKGDGFWVSRKYNLSSTPLRFRIDTKSIRKGVATAVVVSAQADGTCDLVIENRQDVVRYDYARLSRQPALVLRVRTKCPAVAGKMATWHVVDANGQLVDWDVMGRKRDKLAASVTGRETLAAATFKPAGDAAGGSVWAARVPVDIYRYREGAPQQLHFVVDVITDNGSVFLHKPSANSHITVNYELPRVRNIYQIPLRLIPANSLMRVPVVYNIYSPREMQTGLRLAESYLRKPSLYRADSRREGLPTLKQGDNWHASWLYADTPPPGIYSVTAGFVNDPYAWYGDIYSIGGTTALVINPFLFFLCALAGIWFLFRFAARVAGSPRWYGKIVYALAAALVFYLVILPALLSVVGAAAILTYWYFTRLWGATPESYPRRLMIAGLVFGLAMELYWGAGILGEYWHAVVLSAMLQGLLLFIICLPFRRSGIRAAVVVSWFVVWLVVYLTIILYSKFFGQAPTLNILTYAAQGAALTNEIIELFGPVVWAGIAIWCFFPAAVLLGWYRVRASGRASSKPGNVSADA